MGYEVQSGKSRRQEKDRRRARHWRGQKGGFPMGYFEVVAFLPYYLPTYLVFTT